MSSSPHQGSDCLAGSCAMLDPTLPLPFSWMHVVTGWAASFPVGNNAAEASTVPYIWESAFFSFCLGRQQAE